MKKISLLGSTGSIGTQSLDVCEMHGYDVKCLTANSKVDIMEEQIRKFKPDMVCMMSETAAKELKAKISDTNTKVVCGMEGLIECATYDKADTVLNSVVGMVGLQPTLEAIKAKKTLALANKETLVAGGHLVTNLAKENYITGRFRTFSRFPMFSGGTRQSDREGDPYGIRWPVPQLHNGTTGYGNQSPSPETS